MLTCFNDADSRLRYYACEALYNIVKVARGAVLPHFNVLFDGLSKVTAPHSTGLSSPNTPDLTFRDLECWPPFSQMQGEQISTCCQGCLLSVQSNDIFLDGLVNIYVCFSPTPLLIYLQCILQKHQSTTNWRGKKQSFESTDLPYRR